MQIQYVLRGSAEHESILAEISDAASQCGSESGASTNAAQRGGDSVAGGGHEDDKSTCSNSSAGTTKSGTLPYQQRPAEAGAPNSVDNEKTREGLPKVKEAEVMLPGIEAGFAQLGQYLLAGKNGG